LDNHEAVLSFFGVSSLAKDIFEQAGIDCCEEIE